jgi:hypothetical protein
MTANPAILPASRRRRVANEHPAERSGGRWPGRVVAIVIVAFIGLVLALMFLAARGSG